MTRVTVFKRDFSLFLVGFCRFVFSKLYAVLIAVRGVYKSNNQSLIAPLRREKFVAFFFDPLIVVRTISSTYVQLVILETFTPSFTITVRIQSFRPIRRPLRIRCCVRSVRLSLYDGTRSQISTRTRRLSSVCGPNDLVN